MRSLTAHLREPEDHGRLPSIPDCPVCRDERLAGHLPPAARPAANQALLAAGVLASRPPDPVCRRDRARPGARGSAAPRRPVPRTPPTTPTSIPAATRPTFRRSAAGVAGRRAARPRQRRRRRSSRSPRRPDAPIVDAGDGSATSPGAGRPRPARLPRQPERRHPHGGRRPPAAHPRRAASRRAAALPLPIAPRDPTAARGGAATRPRDGGPAATAPPVSPGNQHTDFGAASRHADGRWRRLDSAPRARAAEGRAGRPVHVVLAGESLWSIASDLLGGQARPRRDRARGRPAVGAQQHRIATGDPDLLLVGTSYAAMTDERLMPPAAPDPVPLSTGGRARRAAGRLRRQVHALLVTRAEREEAELERRIRSQPA